MNKYVALLRGINVGGNNKIAMTQLKDCFESLGYSDVITYINSGNVIFATRKKNIDAMTREIEQVIQNKCNLTIPVVIRSQQNIEKISQQIPADWTNDKDNKTDVMFLWDEYAKKSILTDIKTNPKIDTLLYVDGAIIWHLKKKDFNQSKMNDLIGTKIYKHMTVRNINTVRKLRELMT